MRRNRLIWLALFILSVVGISFYGGAVTYGFFFAVLLIPVLALVYIAGVYFTFRIYQRAGSSDITAGEPVPYYFTLQNEGFFAFSSIRVTYFTDFSAIQGLDDTFVYELHPKDGIRRDTTLMCRYRGSYEAGIARVEITDFLRLFRVSYKNPETLHLTVKPAMHFLPALRDVDIDLLAAKNADVNLSEPDLPVRDYVPGDDVRKIQWKATAVRGTLMVRKDTGEEKQGIGVILSTRRISSEMQDYLPVENRILEAAIASGLYFASRNIPVTCRWDRGHAYVNTLESFRGAYERMSAIDFRTDADEAAFLADLSAGGTVTDLRAVFLVVPDVNEPVRAFAEHLSDNNVAVIIYAVSETPPKEIRFEASSRIRVLHLPPGKGLTEVM